MDRDSGKQSIQEMEQIRRGLEEFLDKEVLNQERVEEEGKDNRQNGREPQFFTIEREEEAEKELDIIGVGRKSAGVRNKEYDDYAEDWDSPKYRKRVEAKEPDRQRESQRQQTKKEKRENMRDNKRRSKKKKKKSKFKRFVITILILAFLLLGGLYYLVGVVYARMNYHGIDSVATEAMKEDGVTNILLIGNDSRENGEDGRSDAMILLSISDKTHTIYMTSLLRDMYVEIPGYKGNRLNAAYSFGGAELLMETIERNLDIEINRYMLVNFEAFANLVDAVGGVELELTAEEIEYVNAYLVEYNMLTQRPQGTDNMDASVGGLVHLNGPQALAYTRNRYIGTDFGRTERQRKVLAAVIKSAPRALVQNPGELIDGLLPNLTTNLTRTETFRLGLMAPKLVTYELVQSSLPIEGSYQNATIRGMAVLEVDFEANKQYLKETVYGVSTTK